MKNGFHLSRRAFNVGIATTATLFSTTPALARSHSLGHTTSPSTNYSPEPAVVSILKASASRGNMSFQLGREVCNSAEYGRNSPAIKKMTERQYRAFIKPDAPADLGALVLENSKEIQQTVSKIKQLKKDVEKSLGVVGKLKSGNFMSLLLIIESVDAPEHTEEVGKHKSLGDFMEDVPGNTVDVVYDKLIKPKIEQSKSNRTDFNERAAKEVERIFKEELKKAINEGAESDPFNRSKSGQKAPAKKSKSPGNSRSNINNRNHI
ncbi:hypothetical protein [Fluviibacterium sp. S390]|uniref:hypothetical protein n=1 Tax=Fluviibacterium sp. S390 TaxID=3415139 RepID=UPI003C7BBB8C